MRVSPRQRPMKNKLRESMQGSTKMFIARGAYIWTVGWCFPSRTGTVFCSRIASQNRFWRGRSVFWHSRLYPLSHVRYAR